MTLFMPPTYPVLEYFAHLPCFNDKMPFVGGLIGSFAAYFAALARFHATSVGFFMCRARLYGSRVWVSGIL